MSTFTRCSTSRPSRQPIFTVISPLATARSPDAPPVDARQLHPPPLRQTEELVVLAADRRAAAAQIRVGILVEQRGERIEAAALVRIDELREQRFDLGMPRRRRRRGRPARANATAPWRPRTPGWDPAPGQRRLRRRAEAPARATCTRQRGDEALGGRAFGSRPAMASGRAPAGRRGAAADADAETRDSSARLRDCRRCMRRRGAGALSSDARPTRRPGHSTRGRSAARTRGDGAPRRRRVGWPNGCGRRPPRTPASAWRASARPRFGAAALSSRATRTSHPSRPSHSDAPMISAATAISAPNAVAAGWRRTYPPTPAVSHSGSICCGERSWPIRASSASRPPASATPRPPSRRD